MPKVTEASTPPTVGVIGAGQLARMMAESASEMGLTLRVLAEHADDSATPLADVVLGRPSDPEALAELARGCSVVTLDHELVDRDLLERLIHSGTPVRPAPESLRFAAEKDHQRRDLAARGVPVPRFRVLESPRAGDVSAFADTLGALPVVKAARGGYDGRGVIVAEDLKAAEAAAVTMGRTGPVILEERLDLLGEYAVQVVSDPAGRRRWYPVVATRQDNGMCAEVAHPSGLGSARLAEALDVATRVADAVQAVGVLAVELFDTPHGILVNEVATRPHNSAHWTIEGCATSQFENHLRAVAGLPLGSTEPLSAAAVMVNVVGSDRRSDLAAALAVEGAHIHLYGKAHRPGRKLGHVTALGGDLESARVRAWEGAEALGTAFGRRG